MFDLEFRVCPTFSQELRKQVAHTGNFFLTANLDNYINKILFLKCIISYHFIGGVGAIEVTVTPPAFGDTISVSASKIVFSIAFVFRTLRDKKKSSKHRTFHEIRKKKTIVVSACKIISSIFF